MWQKVHVCKSCCDGERKFFSKISIFLHKSFISLLYFEKEIGGLHCKHIWKHPLFTIFSLFLTVAEIFKISSKYSLPHKSVKNIFTQDSSYSSFTSRTYVPSPSHKFLETSVFYYIFDTFHKARGAQYFR